MQRHRGIGLPVVLMILLALTGLTLFSARNATLSERTARNQLDIERARQAAESALRDAERDLNLTAADAPAGAPCRREVRPISNATYTFDEACTAGQCDGQINSFVNANWNSATSASTDSEPWWPFAKGGKWDDDLANKPRRGSNANCTTFTGGVPLGSFTGVPLIVGVERQPEYLIERIRRPENKFFYRITARGFGAALQTQVVLQSYFRPPDEL
jgi:type IV pilus assembly protein PilX